MTTMLAACTAAWLHGRCLVCYALEGHAKTHRDMTPAATKQLLIQTPCSQHRMGFSQGTQGDVVLTAGQKLGHVIEGCTLPNVQEDVIFLVLQSMA